MKKNITICLRSFTAFCLLISVFVVSSMIVSAAPEKKAAMGELVVSGHNVGGDDPFVMLNGERAFSGRTFFSSGNIATTENSNATIRLGKLGSLSLAPNSNLVLTFDDNSISGKLLAGQVKVFNNEGVNVNIENAEGIVNGEGVLPANARQDDDDDDDDDDLWIPLAVFGGIVATAVVITIISQDDDDRIVSPVR